MLAGSGTPTLTPTIGAQRYRDTTATPGNDTWTASPHRLFWQNDKTGAISPAIAMGLLKVDPVTGVAGIADYELTETAGTVLHDAWGGHSLNLTQSYPTLNGGKGLSYSRQGYVSLPTTLASNAYTYQICSTLPTVWTQPTLLGGTVSSGQPSSFLYDHTLTPAFTQYSQLIAQAGEVNTPFQPSGNGCLGLELNGNTRGSQQFFEGTYKVPMSAQGSGIYSFANITAFYLGNQNGSTQMSFLGKIYKLRVWNGTPSEEYMQYVQAYTRFQLQAAGVALAADGPLAFPNSPLLYMPGDSLDAGVGAFANHAGGDPAYLQAALPASSVVNAGVGSAQMCPASGPGNITANIEHVGAALRSLDPSSANAVILEGGTNDLGAHKSAAEVLSCTQNAIDLLHQQGWAKVIVETILPRNPISLGAPGTAALTAYNSSLLSSRGSAIVLDVASSPIFQYPLQNAQFYLGDGVHLVDAGYRLKAAMERSELNQLGVTKALPQYADSFSPTPDFDMSVSTHHLFPLAGDVTYFTVSGIIPHMHFTIDFQQPAGGTSRYNVPYPTSTTGAGATATLALSGGSLMMTLGSGGNGFYKASFLPIFVPSATCAASTGRWLPSLQSGSVSGLRNTIAASGCSALGSASVKVVSTEPVWRGKPAMPGSRNAAGARVRLTCDVDATATSITCQN